MVSTLSRVRKCKGGIIHTYIPLKDETLATRKRSYIPRYNRKGVPTQAMNKLGMYVWHWKFFNLSLERVRNCKGGIVPTYLHTYLVASIMVSRLSKQKEDTKEEIHFTAPE